jgi:hypothetical protein
MTVRTHPIVRESAVVSALSTARHRVGTLARQSRVLGPVLSRVQTLRTHAKTESADGIAGRSVLAGSRIVDWARAAATQFGTAARGSSLSRLGAATQHLVESSWLYRWLTAEPEPDVIVIDLRETITVGPWLRLLQRTIEWLLPAAVSSTIVRTGRETHRFVVGRPVQLASLLLGFVATGLLATVASSPEPSPVLTAIALMLAGLGVIGSRITWTWDDLRETRGYQALAAAFEPPEPPERPIDDTTRKPHENGEQPEDGSNESHDTTTDPADTDEQ